MVAATPTQSLWHGSFSLSWRHISLESCLQPSRANISPRIDDGSSKVNNPRKNLEEEYLDMEAKCRLSNFVEKALVEDVIPILVVAFHGQLSQLLSYCIQRVARSELDSVAIERELSREREREMRRNSMSGNLSIISKVIADDLNVRLDYLENREVFELHMEELRAKQEEIAKRDKEIKLFVLLFPL